MWLARSTGVSLAVLRASMRYTLLVPAILLDVLAVLVWIVAYTLTIAAGRFK